MSPLTPTTTRPGRGPRPARTGAAALAAVVTFLLAGCGEGGEAVGTSPEAPATGGTVTSTPDPSTTPPARSPAPSATGGDATGATELTVVWDDGSGGTRTFRLTCDPVGGDHPDAAAACRALAENGETALPPVPKDRMCTQIFGGPEKATVSGTWRGRPVNSTFSRTNGCEINRWRSLSGLLPAMGGPNS